MNTVKFISRYDLRVKLVQDTLTKNAKLGDNASRELAIQVLNALDHMSENRR